MFHSDRIWRPTNSPFTTLRYVTKPTIEEGRVFRDECRQNLHLPLAYDIETLSSTGVDEDERETIQGAWRIEQIQFSLRPGEGIVFKWQGEFVELALEILAMEHTKYSFYGHLFDDPILRAAGAKFGGPYPHDLYEMFHHLQPDLPANLQFVASFYGMTMPWKHLAGSDDGYYGCCDVDAPQRILQKIPEQLKKRKLWDGYERLVYRVRPILDRMSERGIPVNDVKRRAFGAELDIAAAEVDAEMQALVPDEIKNVHPKQGYKRTPKDTTGMIERIFQDHTDIDGPADPTGVLRWCRLEPFKVSSQQLIRYMKHKGHPVPINIKRGRETSEAKELERLAKKTHDPLYRKVIWYREVKLMKATFVDGWAPSERDGRVHTTFTFAPAIGQLSSRDPNVQNAPEHEKEGRTTGLADKFQRIMEAPNGYRFVSFDHKSFHALTLAFLAGDPDYMRLVRKDVHSYLASQFLKLKPAEQILSMDDDELTEYLKWVKKTHRHVRDNKSKRVVLAWGNGQSYRSIFQQYPESFENENEAKRLQDTLRGLFPKEDKWQKQIQFKAHYDTYLISAFGFIRWFWDVFNFGPNGQLRHGEQAEQAINYLIANSAFGMMREEVLEMQARGLDERYGLVNNVHDAWKFCCPDNLVEECIHTIKPLMEAPCLSLKHPVVAPDGLWCGVSVTVGKNLGEKSVENPDGREEVNVNVTNPIERSTSITSLDDHSASVPVPAP